MTVMTSWWPIPRVPMFFVHISCPHFHNITGIILCMGSAKERRPYYVTPSLTHQAYTQNDLCFINPFHSENSLKRIQIHICILSQSYFVWLIWLLLMTRRGKETGHQQTWYWPKFLRITKLPLQSELIHYTHMSDHNLQVSEGKIDEK